MNNIDMLKEELAELKNKLETSTNKTDVKNLKNEITELKECIQYAEIEQGFADNCFCDNYGFCNGTSCKYYNNCKC
jgi:hypothetical protein